MIKVLVLQNTLKPYRVDLYREIGKSKEIELAVAHPDTNIPIYEGVEQIRLKKKNVGPFTLVDDLSSLCNRYDVVIAMFDIKWLSYMRLGWIMHRKFKLIYWGIGVSTEKGFDGDSRFDILRKWMAKRADAMLFYSPKVIEKYLRFGFSKDQLFVANNTVKVVLSPDYWNKKTATPKDSIVFIGAFSPRKKVKDLLKVFSEIKKEKLNTNLRLELIGDGVQKEELRNRCYAYGIDHDVYFRGYLEEGLLLEQVFQRAIASVSPGQAGLSVLKSFAYGVPFITEENSITGGERFNIIHGHNGYLYPEGDTVSLRNILLHLIENPKHSQKLGSNAFSHYHKKANISNMAQGFIQAIKAVIQ